MELTVDGVKVKVNDFSEMSIPEIRKYIEYIRDDTSGKITELVISNAGNGNVGLDYTLEMPKFDRIRRITGLSH